MIERMNANLENNSFKFDFVELKVRLFNHIDFQQRTYRIGLIFICANHTTQKSF